MGAEDPLFDLPTFIKFETTVPPKLRIRRKPGEKKPRRTPKIEQTVKRSEKDLPRDWVRATYD